MSALVARHVVRTFGAVTALGDVSLTVGAGEVVGLIGANGSGKTTLIRILLGLIGPDRGEVRLAGAAPSRQARRRVGYAPQGLGLWADLTLREHVELAAGAYGAVETRIPDPGLAEVADHPVGALPLGLRRRAAFLLARAHDPRVIILDEPTAGVDPLARSRLWDTIRATAEAGAAALVATHYVDEAARCDRVVLLADGRVVGRGSVAELVGDRTTVRVAAPRWQAAWQRLEEAGYDVLPAGRDLRVTGAGLVETQRALAGLDAELTTVAATLDEVLLQMAGR